jgi:hypothetical protein
MYSTCSLIPALIRAQLYFYVCVICDSKLHVNGVELEMGWKWGSWGKAIFKGK